MHLTGFRSNASLADFSSILPEEAEEELRSAVEVSMGTEISQEDCENIVHLCDQVIEISEYRAQLYDYLKNRMMAIAPNLTLMVGELVGARLIAHAGEDPTHCLNVSHTMLVNYCIVNFNGEISWGRG